MGRVQGACHNVAEVGAGAVYTMRDTNEAEETPETRQKLPFMWLLVGADLRPLAVVAQVFVLFSRLWILDLRSK